MTHAHHDHQHNHAPQRFNLAFAIAILANLGFTCVEGIYSISAHSMSLLADAGHNLADVLALLLAWIASALLAKMATAKFSYGYKRTTILAAIINALILVGTSTLIGYESIIRILHPAEINARIVITIALLGILINGGTALLFMRGRKDDLNIKGAFLHLAYDALVSLGVVVSGFMIFFKGWLYLDPLVGLLIVIAILSGTWSLLRDSVSLILDAVPSNIDIKKIQAYLGNIAGVNSVHDLHVWGLSTNETALTCHLVMPKDKLDDDAQEKITRHLRDHFHINHATLQTEDLGLCCQQKCAGSHEQ